MSTYETAENKFITVDGIKYAYRLFGAPTGTPLYLSIHFRGNMDWWDPVLVNPLAVHRPILLIDLPGTGRSDGQIGESYKVWAQSVISVVQALHIPAIDVLGFSMGGFTAQLLALDYPKLVRHLIIAGSGPSIGDGIDGGDFANTLTVANAVGEEDSRAALLKTFFPLSAKKQAVGAA
jgi:pimeloyl-ACP methyl ester carboxylesterase